MSLMVYNTDAVAVQSTAVTAFISILASIDVVGNTIVCLLIIKFQDMRIRMNYLILNLAVADIIVALFLVPRSIVAHTVNHPEGISGTVLCKFLTGGVLTWVALVTSVFTLIIIAFERYFAVLDPQIHQRQLNASRLKIIVSTVWMTAVIFNLPSLISVHYNELKSMCIDYWSESWMPKANSIAWVIVTGVIPIFLMAGIYFKVVHYLWYENADNGDSAQQGRVKINRRITKMVMTVSVVFFICWIPALTSLCVLSFHSVAQKQGYALHAVSTILVLFNCAANPFIYVVVSHRFRRHFKELVCCVGASSNAKVYPTTQGKDSGSVQPVQIRLVSLADC
ncbi:galanin receptor 2a-like [Porites lutea]|uniref:galanin receptor 2a-like n=1 Tax=Porites lutea TaxID=51062 RepID=UPI003CC5633C